MEKNGQSVRVVDEHGTVIGYTYPKRANGLVKKCRAEFVTDQEIRLYKQCPTYEHMEDNEMDELKKINYITINPRDWYKCPDMAGANIGERYIISNPLAEAVASAPNMVEILSVGTFDWKGPSHVTNGFIELEPHTDYHLVFWLNGGENDRSDETCLLQIYSVADAQADFGLQFEECLNYRLNRNYIKPLKKYQGWEYYDIPFTTTEATYIQFRFVAEKAPMAVMGAEAPEVYAELANMPDPFEGKRPQRHNIFFEDGWPADKWYSTERLTQQNTSDSKPFWTTASGMQMVRGHFSNLSSDRSEEIQHEIDDRMSELDDRMGEMDDRISELDDRMGEMDDRIIDIDDRLISIDDRMGELMDHMGEIMDRVQNDIMKLFGER